jgi:tRNA threonylcarbamoyl adenosine modification protein YeaZ
VLVLAIDTATPAVTAGVVELEQQSTTVLAERVTQDARAHGELLTPHVLDAVSRSGITLRDLTAVVCGVGPGPFTGLRAGIVTAAALAHSLDIPAYPVCSLDAIAADSVAGPDSAARSSSSPTLDGKRCTGRPTTPRTSHARTRCRKPADLRLDGAARRTRPPESCRLGSGGRGRGTRW